MKRGLLPATNIDVRRLYNLSMMFVVHSCCACIFSIVLLFSRPTSSRLVHCLTSEHALIRFSSSQVRWKISVHYLLMYEVWHSNSSCYRTILLCHANTQKLCKTITFKWSFGCGLNDKISKGTEDPTYPLFCYLDVVFGCSFVGDANQKFLVLSLCWKMLRYHFDASSENHEPTYKNNDVLK